MKLKTSNPAAMVAAFALAVLGVTASHAPVYADVTRHMDADLRAGVYTDADGLAIGGGLLTPLGSQSGWFFNPNMEVVMPDGDNLLTLNGDFHYDFPTSGSLSPYVGGGPALLRRSGNTDLGLNLLAGMAGLQGEVRPFIQLKGVFTDSSDLALMGGVRF